MATEPLQPGAAPANTAAREDAATINKIALDIQDHGYRLQAVSWAIDECINMSPQNPDWEDGLARAMSLSTVAADLLQAMMTRACKIEELTSGVSREAHNG